MTRKKFVSAILDAIGTFASLGEDSPIESAKKFTGCKVGVFYGVDEDGSNEVEHYLLLELKDGTKWRIIPERVLKLDDHERILWDEYVKSEENEFKAVFDSDIEDEDIEEDDEDDNNEFLPPPDFGVKDED